MKKRGGEVKGEQVKRRIFQYSVLATHLRERQQSVLYRTCTPLRQVIMFVWLIAGERTEGEQVKMKGGKVKR